VELEVGVQEVDVLAGHDTRPVQLLDLAQRFDDGQVGAEDQGVPGEAGIVGVLPREDELVEDHRGHQDSLAGAHRQGIDSVGVTHTHQRLFDGVDLRFGGLEALQFLSSQLQGRLALDIAQEHLAVELLGGGIAAHLLEVDVEFQRIHLGRPQPLDPPDVAQDVLRLRQQRLVEGRAGEVAQFVLAAASTAVAQGRVVGCGALDGEGRPKALLKSHHLTVHA